MKKSRLITSNDIFDFVIEMYGITDPVLCVWATDNPPECRENDAGAQEFDLEDAVLFIKEDVETFFFPRGITTGEWNKVIVCVSHIDRPIIGWLMGATPTSFLSTKWLEEIDIDI